MTQYLQYIKIDSLAKLLEQREKLYNYIWKQDSYNTFAINEENANSISQYGLTNLDATRYRVAFGPHTHFLHLIRNSNPNGRLMIYHSGHNGNEGGTGNALSKLRENGFDILIVNMPGVGENNCGGVNYTGGSGKCHNSLGNLETPTFNPMEIFFNGLDQVLPRIQDNYTDISMMGISGGGWATVVYAAVNPRINNSFSVSGSYPRYIYDVQMPNKGDWEQGSPAGNSVWQFLTNEVSYLDMYIMAAHNGIHRSMYNEFDSCCFWGRHFEEYEQHLTDLSASIGGDYGNYLSQSTTHQIPNDTMNEIINTLIPPLPPEPTPPGVTTDSSDIPLNMDASQQNFIVQGLKFELKEDVDRLTVIKDTIDTSNVARLQDGNNGLIVEVPFIGDKADFLKQDIPELVKDSIFYVLTGSEGVFNRRYAKVSNVFPVNKNNVNFIGSFSNGKDRYDSSYTIIAIETEIYGESTTPIQETVTLTTEEKVIELQAKIDDLEQRILELERN